MALKSHFLALLENASVMVWSILRIILDYENEGVAAIPLALRNLLDDAADRVIVVGRLDFRRVYAIDGGPETSGVIVHHANEPQVRQVAIPLELVKFPLPF